MILATVLALLAAAAAAGAPQPQQSFWALVVNGEPKGDVAAVLDGPQTWVPVVALDEAGLRRFGGERRMLFNAPHVLLDSLAPDLTYGRDMSEIVLRIVAAPHFFDTNTVVLQRDRPPGISYAATTTFFTNYSATWDEQDGVSGYGSSGLSVFGNMSLVSSYAVDTDGVFSRGLSTLTVDRPHRRLRLEVGDTVSPPSPLGSAPILAGVSFGRDYSLDPYYYRYPTPFIRGTATAPSDVQIYVNGALLRQVKIGPGPYRLDRLPVTAGLGDVRVVVRDPFGNEEQFNVGLYQPTGVLPRGEHEFQFAGGKLRDDTGAQPTYGDWQGTAFQRVGVTDWLTVGYSGEGNPDVVAAGPTLSMRLARLGELELHTWESRTAAQTHGFAAYGVYTFVAPFLNVTATGQYYDDGFANLFVAPGEASTPEFYQLSAGAPLWSVGSVTYAWEQRRAAAGNLGFTLPNGAFDPEKIRSRALTLQLNLRIFGVQLTTSATMTMARGEKIWTGFAGLTWVPRRGGATVSATHSQQIDLPASRLDISKSLPLGRGVGYRLNASDVDGGTANGQLEVNTRFNRMRVNYDATEGGDRHRAAATVSGGISATRAGVYVTRPLDQSVAVVEVEGLKGVDILLDNTPIGRTGGGGKLLINELLPYLANRISYEEADIPFDYKVPVSSQLVAPPFRGAAYVKFKTARIQGRSGQVVLMVAGAPVVPRYGTIAAKVGDQDVESPLNDQGQFFLDLPDGRHQATVTFKGKPCLVEFEATTGPDLVQDVGTLTCTP